MREGLKLRRFRTAIIAAVAVIAGSVVFVLAVRMSRVDREEIAQVRNQEQEVARPAESIQPQARATRRAESDSTVRQATVVVAEDPAPDGCFVQTYVRSTAGRAKDAERWEYCRSFSIAERGRIDLETSIQKVDCIRVDGRAVPYEHKKKFVLLSADAGPRSVVTIEYCEGNARGEVCRPERDRFFEALGVRTDEQAGDFADAGWGGEAQKDPSGDATKELDAELAQAARDCADPSKRPIVEWRLKSTERLAMKESS